MFGKTCDCPGAPCSESLTAFIYLHLFTDKASQPGAEAPAGLAVPGRWVAYCAQQDNSYVCLAQQRERASLDWHSRPEQKGSGDEGRIWIGRHSTYFSTQEYIAITSEWEREGQRDRQLLRERCRESWGVVIVRTLRHFDTL